MNHKKEGQLSKKPNGTQKGGSFLYNLLPAVVGSSKTRKRVSLHKAEK
jgi:hypothetical protein